MDEVNLYRDIPQFADSPINYPTNIKKYRIIKSNKTNTYFVQLNVGWFFTKWVSVGPLCAFAKAEDAYQWIQKKIYSEIEPKEFVVWSGKHSQNPPQGT
jgi:hypothetical protein